jgi:hypothetical protein
MSQEVKLKYGDIEFYAGEPKLAENNDKLEQDIGKIVLTEKGGKYHADYGSDIYDMIGKYEQPDILAVLSRKKILDALNYFAQIQYRQGLQQAQDLPEILAKIDSIIIARNPNDPSSYYMKIDIKDGTAKNINIAVPIAS